MMDQYFGIKELYEVTLRARDPMQFGDRYIEANEPVLYFENISMSLLTEQNSPIMARGGWANLPRVIWEDRSEVSFQLSEGVMTSVGMSLLLSANVTSNGVEEEPVLVPTREGPFELTPYHDANENKDYQTLVLNHQPILYPSKKTFIFEYERDAIQKKVYGKILQNTDLGVQVAIFQDKNCSINADNTKEYLVDYYYKYGDKALIYTIQKERFNGLFTLEGKFYSKDENEGLNYTNLIYMPKVRVVSDINLRLGERANPTVASFNIIGLPVNGGGNKKSLVLEITRLNSDEE